MRETINTILIRANFKKNFKFDLQAGLTVGLISIPQAMAYASIVGVSPIYGLYTAIIPTIFSALFGNYPFLVSGPTNPTSLVVASTLIAYADAPHYAEVVFAITLFSGLFKLLLGALDLGKMLRFVSNSVIIGFLSAVGVTIVVGQIGNFFGIQLDRGVGIIPPLLSFFRNLSAINWYAFAAGLITLILIILGLKLFGNKIPVALVAVIIGTVLVTILKWNERGVVLVRDVGIPAKVMLSFHVPQVPIREYLNLIVPAAVIAFFGMVETVSIGKAMSQTTGHRVDASKEMIGQGIGSILGGFFQAIPSSGSPSRTATNVSSNARTRFATVIAGFTVFLVLLFFSKLIVLIPMSVLAAVVIHSSVKLINLDVIRQTVKSRHVSAFVTIATFAATLFFDLVTAILIGTVLSIAIYLFESRVNLNGIRFIDGGRVEEVSLKEVREDPPQILILNVSGDLFFGAVDELHDKILAMLNPRVRVLILRVRRMHLLASSGMVVFNRLLTECQEMNIHLMITGITPEIAHPLRDTGFFDRLGGENVFAAEKIIFSSTIQAYQRAEQLILKEGTHLELAKIDK